MSRSLCNFIFLRLIKEKNSKEKVLFTAKHYNNPFIDILYYTFMYGVHSMHFYILKFECTKIRSLIINIDRFLCIFYVKF